MLASLLALLAEPVYTALLAVAVASYFLLVRRAPLPPLPLPPQGTTQLTQSNFGRESEHRRDVGRAYAAGAIYLWDTERGHPPRRLQPATGITAGVEAKASEEHTAALLSAVAAARGGCTRQFAANDVEATGAGRALSNFLFFFGPVAPAPGAAA